MKPKRILAISAGLLVIATVAIAATGRMSPDRNDHDPLICDISFS